MTTKTTAQKNQTQLWNHLYKAELFACGSLPMNDPAREEIKQRFSSLQEYLELLIALSDKEVAK